MKKQLEVSFEKTPLSFLNTMGVIILIIGIAGPVTAWSTYLFEGVVIVSFVWLAICFAFASVLFGIAYLVRCKHIQREINAQDYEIKIKKTNNEDKPLYNKSID